MNAAKKIAVAGATGRLGRHVVDLFERTDTTSSRCPARKASTSSRAKGSTLRWPASRS